MEGMGENSRTAGIVLCGGQSSRMGRSKADLPFGSESMLQRVVRRLRELTEWVVVVHGIGQSLPAFDDRVVLATDPIAFGGPLIGMSSGFRGLEQIPDAVDRVFITSCDAPFLSPAFADLVISLLGDHDIAVPFDNDFHFPLAAAYHTRIASKLAQLIEAGQRRPRALFDICDTRRIPTDSLRGVDPQLKSLRNLNTPEDYRSALQEASLPLPHWLGEE